MVKFCIEVTVKNEQIVRPWFEQAMGLTVCANPRISGQSSTWWHYPQLRDPYNRLYSAQHVPATHLGYVRVSTGEFLRIVYPVYELW